MHAFVLLHGETVVQLLCYYEKFEKGDTCSLKYGSQNGTEKINKKNG